MKYVNRGDPAVPDFTDTDLIIDNNWHELDLSAIVPEAGANHLVHLRIDFGGTGATLEGWLRERGNANTENAERYITRDEATHSRSGLVMTDTQRKIQYRVWIGMNTFNITVRGWLEG